MGEMFQCLDKFNQALEGKISAYIAQRRLALPDPNESIIFVPGSYTPSAVSVAQVVEDRGAWEHTDDTADLDRTLVDPQPFTRLTHQSASSKVEVSPRANIEDSWAMSSNAPHPPSPWNEETPNCFEDIKFSARIDYLN